MSDAQKHKSPAPKNQAFRDVTFGASVAASSAIVRKYRRNRGGL